MAFEVYEVAIELVGALRDPLASLRSSDGDLASQARRAASSIALNVAEARERAGKDRQHLFRVALGSAGELRAALDVARAWGLLGELAHARTLLDRERAMLYRLAYPGR